MVLCQKKGPWLKVSTKRLGGVRLNSGIPGYKESGLTLYPFCSHNLAVISTELGGFMFLAYLVAS